MAVDERHGGDEQIVAFFLIMLIAVITVVAIFLLSKGASLALDDLPGLAGSSYVP